MTEFYKSSIFFVKCRTKFTRTITILILLLSVTGKAAAARYQLQTRVTIAFNGERLNVAVKMLQERTKIRFAYDDKGLAAKKAPVIKFSNRELSEVLHQLLRGTGYEYKLVEDKVVIMPKEKPESPNVQAGGDPGTIKGRIVEFESSQPLPGASVRILELNKGVQSDGEGYYRFTNIPAGKYTLQVSFIGFTSVKLPVLIRTGKETTYDIKLQGSNNLKEVVISSIRKSRAPVAHSTEIQVLEEVKQASMVVSAISSEQITKSADRNAAEAVQRVSGVTVADDRFVIVRGLNQRYNLTYLNDNVAPSTEVYTRAFALDLVPSRIIDRIMVFKSPAPENLADATGGVVKIYTKDAKTVKHFDIELQTGYRIGTTFNSNFLTYKGGKLDFLGIDDGTRKLPSSVPEYGDLNLAQLTPSQYAKAFNPTLSYQKTRALPNLQVTANYYNAFKLWGRTLSSLTSLSYKNEALQTDVTRQEGINEANATSTDRASNDNRNIQTAQLNLLQNFTYTLRDSSTLSFKNFFLQQGQDGVIVRVSHPTHHIPNSNTDVYNKDNILSFTQRFLYAGNLGGTHYFDHGRSKFQWNGGYTYSRLETPDQRVIRFTVPGSGIAIGDTSLQWRARGQNLEFTDSDDPIASKLGMISRLWMRNTEGNYNGSADYTFKWKPWLAIKAGTFHHWKERRLYRRLFTVHEGDIDNPENTRINPGTNHYIVPRLNRYREQDIAGVWSEEYLRDDYAGIRVHDRTSGSDTYTGTEQNNSGYMALMLTPLNRRIEAYGGLRFEHNRQKIGAAIPKPTSPGINIPVFIDNPMNTWLPSLNVSWRPDTSWVLRAAYGKTVNRTEFREVAPYSELDFENNLQVSGNPDLKSATVNNYDFRAEFYPRKNTKGEVISVGVFYKQLEDPIERINTSSRILTLFPSVSYQNAASATIKGLEVEMNKKLDFLPGKLFRDLSVIANVTIIRSETVNDTTSSGSLSFMTHKRPLQGQAPYIINTGLYYDNAAWGTRISAIYNTSGTNIYAAGRGYRENPNIIGPEYRGSLMELQKHMLDIAISQRIVKSLQAKLSIQNLLDQEYRIAEDYNFTNKYEPVREIPEGERTGSSVREGDNISSRFRPGRYIFFNLSYSF
ncbi:TonB-dependent receptor [Desertivirga xinjiangensis]|uniref:TonB-dependent receptor n=1 Tax=Desertivirga xinjiangensis TaxID=539206 RepID=UPI00210C1CB8|nr:TonB-dependent receptor [Pedobacter xinjiangensis]